VVLGAVVTEPIRFPVNLERPDPRALRATHSPVGARGRRTARHSVAQRVMDDIAALLT